MAKQKARIRKPKRTPAVERGVTMAFIRCIVKESELTADTIWDECLRDKQLAKKQSRIAAYFPALFRHFASGAVGALEQTGRFILSSRSSTPLPVYRTVKKGK